MRFVWTCSHTRRRRLKEKSPYRINVSTALMCTTPRSRVRIPSMHVYRQCIPANVNKRTQCHILRISETAPGFSLTVGGLCMCVGMGPPHPR